MVPLIGQLELMHPSRLVAIALLPLIVYLAWRTTTMMLSWQRISSTVVRSIIFLLLVVAIARPVGRDQVGRQAVVFVTDVSLSTRGASDAARSFIDQANGHRGDHLVRFVPFAATPGEPADSLDLTREVSAQLGPEQSDPSAALLLAAGILPPDHVGKIVLLTDGQETQGELFVAAQGVHVPVDVVPLDPFATAEVCVNRIVAPVHAPPQAAFDVDVVVTANRETTGTIVLSRDGEEFDRRETTLREGDNSLRFRASVAAESPTVFTAGVTAADDTIPENNRRRALVLSDAPPKTLIVAAQPAAAQPLREALSEAGFRMAPVKRPDEIPLTDKLLAGLDLVVLFDLPPSSVATSTGEALRRYVEGGGGLIAVGGKASFAEDVFNTSALEPILPIKALKRREQRRPVVALVLVVDISDSMKKDGRLELAKVAAQKAVNVLTDEDKVGVIVFGDHSKWISDLAPLTDRPAVLDRIAALQTKGVTNMYPALEKAYVALEQVVADRRNVIVLTDGVPSPGDFDRLARSMAEANITVSTVTVSPGADQTIMEDIADLAGGRHFHCDDPNELQDILQREARRATAPRAAVEFRARTLRLLPGLDLAAAPSLTGYAATSPKPKSEVLLVTAEGDPLLSWWRYGQGIAVAMTSPGSVNGGWKTWKGYRPFWEQLARHATRYREPTGVAADFQVTGAGVSVVLDAFRRDGSLIDGGDATLRVTGREGDAQEFRLDQIAPGRFGGTIPVQQPDAYAVEITISQADRVLLDAKRSLCLDYPAELRLRGVDTALLRNVAAVTGGVYGPGPEQIFADDGRRVDRLTPWWPPLLMAALLLFVVDVLLRRARFSFRVQPTRLDRFHFD